MADPSMCYRELRSYKYQLTEDYALAIGVAAEQDFDGSFLSLTSTGKLTVKNRYAWDGPSGPTIDTANFASLSSNFTNTLLRRRNAGRLSSLIGYPIAGPASPIGREACFRLLGFELVS